MPDSVSKKVLTSLTTLLAVFAEAICGYCLLFPRRTALLYADRGVSYGCLFSLAQNNSAQKYDVIKLSRAVSSLDSKSLM